MFCWSEQEVWFIVSQIKHEPRISGKKKRKKNPTQLLSLTYFHNHVLAVILNSFYISSIGKYLDLSVDGFERFVYWLGFGFGRDYLESRWYLGTPCTRPKWAICQKPTLPPTRKAKKPLFHPLVLVSDHRRKLLRSSVLLHLSENKSSHWENYSDKS